MAARNNGQLGAVPPADLVYAVQQLIAAGKTTSQEIRRLAGGRSNRIATLEAELAALKGGTVVAAPATGKAKVAAKPKKPAPVGQTILLRDGRTFTRSPKVVEARRLQGAYIGLLRGVPKGKTYERFQAIAKQKGVAAAVEALRKYRAGIVARGASAPVAKVVSTKTASTGTAQPTKGQPATPSKKTMPPGFYRCTHPGCTKNWYVNGRPYCAEHTKEHGNGEPPPL